jgi:hypothetical protein
MAAPRTNNEFEKTMIEAGALLITLLFIVAQMLPNLPNVRPLGDLFAAASVFVIGILVAAVCMFLSPPTIVEDADTAALRVAGRAIVFFSFFFGLAMLVSLFYDLATAIGARVDLANSLWFLVAVGIAVYFYIRISKQYDVRGQWTVLIGKLLSKLEKFVDFLRKGHKRKQ